VLAQTGWGVAEISAVIMAVLTAVYTLGTFLLWITTRRYVQLTQEMVSKLAQQVSHQIVLSETESKNSITDAHRELFLSILSNEKLFPVLVGELGLGEQAFLKKMLATLLINHCSSIHIYYERGIIDYAGFEGFKRDAKDMFAMPLIRKRWDEVGKLHNEKFRDFVNVQLLNLSKAADPVVANELPGA
jgi:hypothetical protein